MKNFNFASIGKGVLIGLGFGLLVCSYYYSIIKEWSFFYLFPALLLIINGIILGYYSGTLTYHRFKYLFSIAIILYLIDSFAASLLMSYTSDYPYETPILEIVLNSIKLSLVGSALFAIFFLPVIAILVYGLERWTRSDIP